jgi:hypothetical protein
MLLINDSARAMHLLGMALGFGIAIMADLWAARTVLRPLDDKDLETLEIMHRLVSMGLVLLWVSGLTLLWLRTGFEAERFSPKLMTKIGVVAMLTLNAIAIGRIGLPTMRANQEVRFGDLPVVLRLQLASLGTISAACWVSALLLGVYSQMKSMNWDALSNFVGVVYLIALLAAVFAASVTPLVATWIKLREARPRLFAPLPKFRP